MESKNYYKTRKRFTPVPGKWYENEGGGLFLCLNVGGFLREYDAQMQSKNTRWTFTAHGCGMYEDGRIDWDHSTGGHFMRE